MMGVGFQALSPGLLPCSPLLGPPLQAAGVQLGFVDDLDGDLEMEDREKVKVPQALKLGKGSLIQTPRYVLPLSLSETALSPGHS